MSSPHSAMRFISSQLRSPPPAVSPRTVTFSPAPEVLAKKSGPICADCGATVATYSELMGKHKKVCSVIVKLEHSTAPPAKDLVVKAGLMCQDCGMAVASYSDMLGPHKKVCSGKCEVLLSPPAPEFTATASATPSRQAAGESLVASLQDPASTVRKTDGPVCSACGVAQASFSDLLGAHKKICPQKNAAEMTSMGLHGVKLKNRGDTVMSSVHQQLGRVVRGPSCPDCGAEVRSIDDIDGSHQAVCTRPEVGAQRRKKMQDEKEVKEKILRLEKASEEKAHQQQLIDDEADRVALEQKCQLVRKEELARDIAKERYHEDRTRIRIKQLAEWRAEDAEDERQGLPHKPCRWCKGNNRIVCDLCRGKGSQAYCKHCKNLRFNLCNFCEDGRRIWGWYDPWHSVWFGADHPEEYYLEQVRKELRENTSV
jgi:hypothetical protein